MLEAGLIAAGLIAVAAAVLVAGRAVAGAIAAAEETREKRLRTWVSLAASRTHVPARTKS
jgi:hypothetical protein